MNFDVLSSFFPLIKLKCFVSLDALEAQITFPDEIQVDPVANVQEILIFSVDTITAAVNEDPNIVVFLEDTITAQVTAEETTVITEAETTRAAVNEDSDIVVF